MVNSSGGNVATATYTFTAASGNAGIAYTNGLVYTLSSGTFTNFTSIYVPTADERILHKGTAYQTDVGMSGPFDSVIGVETDLVLQRFLTGMPGKFEPAKGNPKMCATLIECDGGTGRATGIRRLMLGE